MSNYNKNIYILTDILGYSLVEPGSPAGLDTTRVKDKFRQQTGNYWTQYQGSLPEYGDAESTIARDNPRRKVDRLRIIPDKISKKTQNGFPYFTVEQEFFIYSDKSLWENNSQNWQDYVNETIETGKKFYDICFDAYAPASSERLDLRNSPKGSPYYKVDYDYNYYAEIYEKSINSSGSIERFLPNVYNFLSYRNDSEDSEKIDDKVFQALTMGGQIEENVLRSFGAPTSEETNIDFFSYFDKFGNQIETIPTAALGYMRNIAFDTSANQIRKDADKYASAFPMYVNFEFLSEVTTEFAEVLKDSELTREVMSYLSYTPKGEVGYDILNLILRSTFEQFAFDEDANGERTMDSRLSSRDLPSAFIDMGAWINQVFQGADPINSDDFLFIQDNGKKRKLSPKERVLYLIIFSGKLKNIIEKHFRNFVQISEGQQSYSETLIYKIDKFAGGNEPIQTIWLPNTNELAVMRYIDTQVKFNTKYTYRVSAFQAVIGTEYEYLDIQFPEEYDPTDITREGEDRTPIDDSSFFVEFYDKNKLKTKFANTLFINNDRRGMVNMATNYLASMKIRSKPCVKIVEVPLFRNEGVIIDDPPVPPEVKVIPYKNVKNKILFNLNSSVGSYDMMPVTFSDAERKIVDSIRETKKLPENSPITFTTDDRVAQFEIYRMTTPPETVTDFIGNLLTTVITDVDTTTQQKSSSAAYIDNIQPNTDYYYMVRAIDIHQKVSNPSTVYRVRLVENSGAIYPLIEAYHLKDVKPQTTSKTCKRLFNLRPELFQTLISPKSDLGGGASASEVKNIVLGQKEQPLFGRTFKVRFTSKKTGKQIDVNMTFDVELHKK